MRPNVYYNYYQLLIPFELFESPGIDGWDKSKDADRPNQVLQKASIMDQEIWGRDQPRT